MPLSLATRPRPVADRGQPAYGRCYVVPVTDRALDPTDVETGGTGATPGKHTRVMIVCNLGVALVTGTTVALNSALGDIAVHTSASQSQLTWIVDSYTVVLAALVFPAGALGDRFGRRGALLVGLVTFVVASLMPLALTDPTQLIVARAIAGVGAAFIMPSTLSLITAAYPPDQRGRAIGIWSAVGGSSAIVAMLGSGLLLEYWSWQSIFWVLGGLGVVTLAAACLVPTSRDETETPLDIIGSVLICAAVGVFVFGVLEAPLRGWTDTVVVGTMAAGVLGTAAFGVVEYRRSHPLLDVRLFRRPDFTTAVVTIVAMSFAVFALFFLAIQYVQLILGYSPLLTGVALSPLIVPLGVLSVLAPWFGPRLGLRLTAFLGLGLLAVGFFMMSTLRIDSSYWESVGSWIVMSFGIGLCMTPATSAIMAAVPGEKQGVASAVNDTTRELGAALGIAVAGSILAAQYGRVVTPQLVAFPAQVRDVAAQSLAAALDLAPHLGPQADALSTLASTGFMDAMRSSSLAIGVILVVSAVVCGLWAPGRHGTQLPWVSRAVTSRR
jgi:EmrB/QacA subfamily drug resistance transporter